MFYQTQAEYDLLVQNFIDYEVRLANRCALLREQNDPSAFGREEQLMMLQNVIFGLKDYDITWDYLTQTEIDYYFEIATTLIQNCTL